MTCSGVGVCQERRLGGEISEGRGRGGGRERHGEREGEICRRERGRATKPLRRQVGKLMREMGRNNYDTEGLSSNDKGVDGSNH